MAKCAEADASSPHDFRQEVVELSERLKIVLQNSLKIEEYSYDPEMTADLYYQMSKGYVASPDLRAAWLQNLAQYHEKVIFTLTVTLKKGLWF